MSMENGILVLLFAAQLFKLSCLNKDCLSVCLNHSNGTEPKMIVIVKS